MEAICKYGLIITLVCAMVSKGSSQTQSSLSTPTSTVPTAPSPIQTQAVPPTSTTTSSEAPRVEKKKIEISQEANAKVGFVFSAPLRQGSTKLGETEELNSSIEYVASPRLNKDWILRTGFAWDYISTGKYPSTAVSPSPLMPIPNTLQSTAAIIGFDVMAADDWLVRVDFAPGIYSDFEDISVDDFNIPFTAGASWFLNQDLQLVFGLSVNTWRSIPILPGIGVRWQFADSWTLMAIPPAPRVIYKVHDQVDLFLGGSFLGGTYRVGEHFGDSNGRPDLNGTIVENTEIRLGGGATWKPLPALSVELETGAMVYRTLDYSRANLNYHSSPAPYIQLGVSGSF